MTATDYGADIVAFIRTFCRVDSDYTSNRVPLVPDYVSKWLRIVFPLAAGGDAIALNLSDFRTKKEGKSHLSSCVGLFVAARRPNSEVVIASSDLDASRDRVLSFCKYSVRHGPLAAHCKVLKDSITFDNGSRVVAIARDWRGASGGNYDALIFDELWNWTEEAQARMFDELLPPPSKPHAFRWLSSYAGIMGESDLLAEWWERAKSGERIDPELPIFRDASSSFVAFLDEGEASWRAPWLQGEAGRRYIESVRQTERSTTFDRLWLNQWTAGESSFVSLDEWRACGADIKRWQTGDSRKLFMAADASVGHDSTALVGVAFNKSTMRLEVVYTHVWLPAVINVGRGGAFRSGKATVDLSLLEAEVLRLHKLGAVRELRYDPYQLSSISLNLARSGVKVVEVPQGGPRIECDGALRDYITQGIIAHDGDELLESHVLGAVMRETLRGARLDKSKASRRIDLAVCLSMAAYAAMQGEVGNSTWVGITVIDGLLVDRPRVVYRHIEPGGRKPLTQFEWEKRSEEARKRDGSLSDHWHAQQARRFGRL